MILNAAQGYVNHFSELLKIRHKFGIYAGLSFNKLLVLNIQKIHQIPS